MRDLRVLGSPVHEFSQAQAVNILMEAMTSAGRCRVATINPEIAVQVRRDPDLKAALATADLVVPDGIGIVLALWFQGKRVQRLPGFDLAEAVLKRLAQHCGRFYLLGGRPGVAVRAGARLTRSFPGLSLVGAGHGYFPMEENALIVKEIRQARPHLLLVGMGSPHQEVWLAKHWNELEVPVGISVGGSIDLWAGDLKRAPAWMRRYGLEWLFRLFQEPARLRRMKFLPVFVYQTLLSSKRGACDEE